jgi:hypothetical protein
MNWLIDIVSCTKSKVHSSFLLFGWAYSREGFRISYQRTLWCSLSSANRRSTLLHLRVTAWSFDNLTSAWQNQMPQIPSQSFQLALQLSKVRLHWNWVWADNRQGGYRVNCWGYLHSYGLEIDWERNNTTIFPFWKIISFGLSLVQWYLSGRDGVKFSCMYNIRQTYGKAYIWDPFGEQIGSPSRFCHSFGLQWFALLVPIWGCQSWYSECEVVLH